MLLLSTLAYAADPVPAPRPQLPAVTEIDFRELEVKGELVGPQIGVNFVARQLSFNPLIQLRKDWKTETLQSIDYVR